MNKKFISDFKPNEQIDSCFVLRKKNLKLTKYDKPYLEITLSDRTGKIEGRLWENAESFNEAADTGDVVEVRGVVDKYRDEKQFKIDCIVKADERAYRYEDMVRVVENRDKLYEKLLGYLKALKNPWIKILAEGFISDEEFVATFKEGIGGKSWHNAYIGGLLEHTYEVMFVAGYVCDLYPEADRDTVIFGAFIHDIGKTFELDPKKMEYTVEGGLIGHITIGYRLLIEKIRSIPNFPGELRLRLEHIILSHHGEYEQQSPVLPKTLEATIVYQTDELVSQSNAIKELGLSQQEEGRIWSDFVVVKERKYYIKDSKKESWVSTQLPQETKEKEQIFPF